MDMEFKYGQMEPVTKVNGRTTKLMEKESFGMLMEMCLMGNGKMTKPMDMVFTLM